MIGRSPMVIVRTRAYLVRKCRTPTHPRTHSAAAAIHPCLGLQRAERIPGDPDGHERRKERTMEPAERPWPDGRLSKRQPSRASAGRASLLMLRPADGMDRRIIDAVVVRDFQFQSGPIRSTAVRKQRRTAYLHTSSYIDSWQGARGGSRGEDDFCFDLLTWIRPRLQPLQC